MEPQDIEAVLIIANNVTCMESCRCAGDIVVYTVMCIIVVIIRRYPRISGILRIQYIMRGILLYIIMLEPLDAFMIL